MKCELRVTSGAREGQREVFDKSYIGVGRHPLSDLRFDAEHDLDASSRHAALVRTGEVWTLRDLGSTNGTFVNGERITADRALKDGDTLRFGLHGPEVAFALIGESQDEVIMPAMQAPARASSSAPPAPPPASPPPAAPRGVPRPTGGRDGPPPSTREDLNEAPPAHRPHSKTGMLRAEIQDQRARFRVIAAALFVVMVGALGIIIWQGRAAQDAQTTTRRQLDSMRVELAALRRLQVRADSEATALRTQIAAEQDAGRRQSLQSRLSTVEVRSSHIAAAQAVDWNRVVRLNRPAIAIIYVKFPDSSIWSGTAFNVTASGLMLTNRHLVRNDAGQRAVEIAVQFSDSPDVLPARIANVSRDADLATIQLESAGPFPVVTGLADAVPGAGDPIGLIGYPFGRELPQGEHPTASLFNGSVSRVLADSLLQLDAWSGQGASGSPIFDRTGRVVGVEFGGIAETGGRVVLGLPIRRAQALLNP